MVTKFVKLFPLVKYHQKGLWRGMEQAWIEVHSRMTEVLGKLIDNIKARGVQD